MSIDKMYSKNIITGGLPLGQSDKVLIMVHGRGGSAKDILLLKDHLQVGDYTLLAPQATGNTWYPFSFMAPPEQNEPGLSLALESLGQLEKELHKEGYSSDSLFFLGFSQGACLTLEYTTRHAKKYGGIIAFTGGLIGDKLYKKNYQGDFGKTPIYIGTSDPDPHVPVERVVETQDILRQMNAQVKVSIYKNMGHTINYEEIDQANAILTD